MSLRNFPNFLQAYMEYTKNSEAPDTFHFWTGISCIAGALQRKVWIDCKYWEWVPNFYIIFVAPPGIVSKSTTAGIGMNLLRQVPKVKFGPDSATWQVLVEELGKSCVAFQTNDPAKGTVFHKMSAMTVVASELGTFLKPQDTEMIDALVSLWDGQKGDWRKATKTQGSDRLVNPWINLIGCTPPAWISATFPDYMIGGGFTSRAIFVYADRKRRLVAYPGREKSPVDKKLQEQLVQDLTHISTIAGEMRLTPEAYEVGEKWYHQFHSNRPRHLDNDKFAGYIARKQTHIHKLAMVLSAAESDSLEIEPKHLEDAIAIVTSLEEDMPKVFSRIGQEGQARRAAQLRAVILAYKEIKLSDLYTKALEAGMTHKEIDDAITGAVLAKHCVKVQRGNVMYIQSVNAQ